MTIRERDAELDREYSAKTGHSIHEARWAMNPCYNPDAPVGRETSPAQEIAASIIGSVIMLALGIWFMSSAPGCMLRFH